jgi:hypothetical protein
MDVHFFFVHTRIIDMITPYKSYLALALKKNQKYCFDELANTTSMNLNLIYLLFRLFKAIYSYRICKSISNTPFKVN